MNTIPKPEFPRPDERRKFWLNLNGEWEFAFFEQGEDERAFAKNRSQYAQRIVVPFAWGCPLSGVSHKEPGIGWYRKKVSFDTADRVFLRIGGADDIAEVYVNGLLVGSHEGGYTEIVLDVSEAWNQGENTIEVRVEDERRESQLYGKQGYGEIQGIWQTVWLESRPKSYLIRHRFVTHIDGEVEISAQVCAPDGATLAARFDGQEAKGTVCGGQVALKLHLSSPRLWSPDTPFLYEGELILKDGDAEDCVETYFGLREIGVRTRPEGSWITLNGQPVYLNGVLNQSFHPQGYFTYPDEETVKDEVWRIKRLGLNLSRVHIKTEEPRLLYWMDKLGVMAMADVPCFWGEPNEEARANYERQWPEILNRDFNHPSIIAWMMFNESWGLLSGESREYLPQTQAWVADVYRRAKLLDPTRLIEDNSPCRYDHTLTDLNTWHFYLNGYEIVRDHIRKVVEETFPGSGFNCVGDYRQNGAPLMNSECGMVWGVDESAGDSDLAWQYHYMLNEYRLHDKICGFVFTEFHDVVNEFNGYYRIDNTDKVWGYDGYCRGMSLRDLHAADFIATDCAPCRTVQAGESVCTPLTLSSFSSVLKAGGMLRWELWHESAAGTVTDALGETALPEHRFGATALPSLTVQMPREAAVAVLSLYLSTKEGKIISRNFTTFDVRGPQPSGTVELDVASGQAQGFEPVWKAQNGQKLCMGGSGSVCYQVSLPHYENVGRLTLLMEAGAKRVLQKDWGDSKCSKADLDYMLGYLVDRGSFVNSYWMSDEEQLCSELEILIDGEPISTIRLENDWADSRGVLSWHYQPNPRRLDEAGSYGQRIEVAVPSRLIPRLLEKGFFTLTLKAGENGLALYGRNSGRYPFGLQLLVEE